MLFNTINFAIFFPAIFCIYWILKGKLRIQNSLLLIASIFFYSCWDYRFAFLLLFTIVLDYFTGIKMEKSMTNSTKKMWFWLSIGVNLGFLGFFKYYNFFIDSFASLIANFGFEANLWTLKIILPVGISFYTFHGLSYVIDIYKNRIKAERNFIDYALFVSFFPLLVAGPIERATHLLPQIKKNRNFSYENAVSGMRQILWGLFKKVVIADQCAEYVNLIFNQSADLGGSTLVLGAVLFSFQIYGDFSGYSDIALGTARLLGFDLLKNFSFPYFSRDIAEFWRRWHISLSTWFRDYIYFPLGGSKVSKVTQIRNTFIIFLVSGFWHGANWTFIFWGLLNAIYFLPIMLLNLNRNNLEIVAKGKLLPTFKELLAIFVTFSLTVFAWIFFRANSLSHAFNYVSNIFSKDLFSIPNFEERLDAFYCLIFVLVLVLVEWFGREGEFALEKLFIKSKVYIRWTFYLFIVLLILLYFGKEEQFIYFQF